MRSRILTGAIFLGLVFLMHLSSSGLFAQKENREVEVISNPKLPVYKGDIKVKLAFMEELSIGQIEGDENYMFGQGIAFNTDKEGYFYVTDFENSRVIKYSPAGEFILSFGAKGQGPGEFQNMSVVRFDKDENLYLTDTSNRRISFFKKNGDFLSQVSLTDRFLDLYINSEGNVAARKWVITQEENAMKQISIFGIFDKKFEVQTEIYTDEIETPMPSGADEASIVQSLASSYSVLAFRPEPSMVLEEGGSIYFGFPDDYEIDIYSPQGEPRRKIKRVYEPRRINNDDKEFYLQYLGEMLSSSGNIPQGTLEQVYTKIKFPSHKPAFQRFVLMENGWLFVIVESLGDERSLIDLFDGSGKYVAQFESTIPVEGIFFKNDKVYVISTENDYKFVRRYSFDIQEY